MKLKTTLKAFAAAALLSSAFSASAEYVDFTVNEGYATDSAESLITANRVSGNFGETVTLDGNNFTVGALVNFTAFHNGLAEINESGLNNTYGLYALFTAEGTVNQSTGMFTTSSGQFNIYLDVGNDLEDLSGVSTGSITSPSDNGFLPSDNGVDILLGTAPTISQNFAFAFNGQGAFNFDFLNFSLTDEGSNYFVEPDPFSFELNVDGSFQGDQSSNVIEFTGTANGRFYEIPEPSTVAIMALGLIGVGALRRQKA
ncbi:flocculation-associated PEP-CTERM protein PepA [Salinimonas lutimaris]|uniref:flocculation-associated PEP-CTERM protein PepA n=1 Tax=Salinimonas lutimaris TaxID=914153 RepID=UPI0010C0D265|nr:flocculation-associated PEP-CTERM protein PepA [Salinimonas lutimaris]